MAGLKERLLKASTNKLTATLSESKFFNEKTMVRTKIPILNVALTGDITGGLQSGLTVLAGPSKHFKSNMGLTLVSAYMTAFPDAICLFYDSEFGVTSSYLKSMNVDPTRVIHTPIKNVEELKIDMVNQLEAIERGEKVIVFIDSIGNTASKKELEDALNEKSVADMSRAKQLKSLFRIVTPYLTLKDIPCVAVNHTIQTMEMFSKTVMTGGSGVLYSANDVFIIGRRQIKDGSELEGYQFVINIDKSRSVREKSKFFIDVTFDGGIDPYSGLLDIGLELGFVVKPKNGWYTQRFIDETTGESIDGEKNWRAKETRSIDFWAPLIKHEPFRKAIRDTYQLGQIISNEELEDEVNQLMDMEPEKVVSSKVNDLEDELESLKD